MKQSKYWAKKQTFFANKCEVQEDLNDNRTLRKYTNPQTNEPGEVYEFQSQDLSGLPESFYIESSEFGDSLCIGLQGSDYVNIVKFKIFRASGGLTADICKLARVVANIDFSKELTISIWENFKGAKVGDDGKTRVPVYLMFKQDDGSGAKWPKSVASSYEWNDDNHGYDGIPPVEVRESMGKTVYDSEKRDEFFYGIIQKAITDNESILGEAKDSRPVTPAEESASEVEVVEDESCLF